MLFVSLPLLVLGFMVEHWLPLEGRWVDVGAGVAGALAVALILIKVDKVRDLRRQHREAEMEPQKWA